MTQKNSDPMEDHIKEREKKKFGSLDISMGRMATMDDSSKMSPAQAMNISSYNASSLVEQTAKSFGGKMKSFEMLGIGMHNAEHAMINQASAQLFIAYLQITEILFFEFDSFYITGVTQGMKELGLWHREYKKEMNKMVALLDEARGYTSKADRNMLWNFCAPIFPHFVSEYRGENGSLTQWLQRKFFERFREEVFQIESLTRITLNMCHKSELNPLIAKLQIITLMGDTYKQLRGVLADRIKRNIPMADFLNMSHKDYNGIFMDQAMKMMSLFKVDQILMPDREALELRKLGEKFQQKMIQVEMLDFVQGTIQEVIKDFGLWTIAKLRFVMDENNGHIPFGYMRVMMARLGSYDAVKLTLKEIYHLPKPSDIEVDEDDELMVMDYAQDILKKKIKKNTLVSALLDSYLDDKYFIPKDGKSIPMRARKLRTIAERYGGVLPMTELKKLYKKMGTKKAVAEALRRGGKALEPSLELLNKTKVTQLRAA